MKKFQWYKYMTSWFLLYAFGVTLFNLSGYDDKDLLLYFSNPVGWFWSVKPVFLHLVFDTEWIRKAFIIGYMILFWLVSGLFLDTFLHRKCRLKRIIILILILITTILVFLILNHSYKIKRSETEIVNILRFSEQYNSDTVTTAISIALKEGYAADHIYELRALIKSTDNENIKSRGLYALSKLGTAEAIDVMLEVENDESTLISYLFPAKPYISSLLHLNKTSKQIEVGIRAAAVFRSPAFQVALNKLIEQHPEQYIVESAKEVYTLIEQNPYQ